MKTKLYLPYYHFASYSLDIISWNARYGKTWNNQWSPHNKHKSGFYQHSTGTGFSTSLCHTTLRICMFSSWFLTIELILVVRCRGTTISWSRTLLFLFEGWPVGITLMLTGIIPLLRFLASIVFFVPQLLLFNLLHIDRQHWYIYVTY